MYYEKIRMDYFGNEMAFDLNNELYDWNKDAPSIMIYYKTDTVASAPTSTGSNFSAGNLVLSGVTGLAVGAAGTDLILLALSKKRKRVAA